MQVGDKFLFAEQVGKTLQALVREDADFVREVLFEFEYLRSASMARCRSSFSAPLRQKIFTSTTVPSMPGGQ